MLPLTDHDLRRLVGATGIPWRQLVQWVGKDGIDLSDRQWFVLLRPGPRTMVLRHRRGRCVYLGADDRCTAYESRPLGCRVFPLDPEFSTRGTLRRLELIEATECPYELDGHHNVADLRTLQQQYDAENDAYLTQVASWNQLQRQRLRRGLKPEPATRFLHFLGF